VKQREVGPDCVAWCVLPGYTSVVFVSRGRGKVGAGTRSVASVR